MSIHARNRKTLTGTESRLPLITRMFYLRIDLVAVDRSFW